MSKEDKGKVKMTVIHFETESDNDTLKENIRSIAHTLVKAMTQNQKVCVTQQLGAGQENVEEKEMVEDDEFFEETISGDNKNSSEKKKSQARQYRTPQPLDVDLTSGDLAFKDFILQKNPDTDLKKYLAIAYWFKKYRGVEEISADHAYTCYRFIGTGWQIPTDPSQPFRTMKTKQYGWMKSGSAKGFYIINHIGENEVEKMGTN